MKRLLTIIAISLLVTACSEPQNTIEKDLRQPIIVWKPVVVKKKYSEQRAAKDPVFGTGNWFSTSYYIVDVNNKVWTCIDQNEFIICDIGDTLWTRNNMCLDLKKK